MSTSLVPVADVERMARAVAASKLFGVQSPDAALALMLVAQAEGRHPASAANDYNIIQGRPAKKSDAMLRDFLSAGGRVQWLALTDEKVEATFSHAAGGSVTISWDIARAKRAQLGGKDMWAKFPRQMLRARVVSEGVRTVFPAATSGMYVPEEVTSMPAAPVQAQASVVDMGSAEFVEAPAMSDTQIDALMATVEAALDTDAVKMAGRAALAACREAKDKDAAQRITARVLARLDDLKASA